jgi:hypothetical protein
MSVTALISELRRILKAGRGGGQVLLASATVRDRVG